MKKIYFPALVLTFAAALSSCGTTAAPQESLPADSIDDTTEAYIESREEIDVQTFCGGIYDGREKIKFVALGDSIARGHGLSDPENCAYPAIVCESVRQNLPDTEVDFYNYAHDGDTTGNLLEIVKNGAPELDGADIVTVSIGANNILLPFFSCLSRLTSVLGLSPSASESTDIADRVENVFESVNSFLKSEEFASSMSQGVETAKSDLSEIFAEIKRRAPSAKVLVMLVYSPYHNTVISLPYIEQKIDLGTLCDLWVSRLDAVLRDASLTSGFYMVDCYTPMLDKKGLLNVAISLFPPRFSIDPHPNVSGHVSIANLHIDVLNSIK